MVLGTYSLINYNGSVALDVNMNAFIFPLYQEVPEGAPDCLAGSTFVISGTLDR